MKTNELATVPNKKSTKKLLLILSSPFWIPVVAFFLFDTIINPIANNFDRQKYETLDTEMKTLYENLKQIADISENWEYKKDCYGNSTGGWLTDGTYTCKIMITIKKTASKATDLSNLHDKYYSIIESNKYIKPLSDLSIYNNDYFGKKFVVNGAEKNYTNINTGADCKYLVELDQSDENSHINNQLYGSAIVDNNGQVVSIISCYGKRALQDWYGE